MEPQERYYRRSYNAINRLIEVYKNGYNRENTLKFRRELISKYKSNPIVAQSEFNSIMFTAMVALLGLNKEAIEESGKIIEYKKNNNEVDMSNFKFNNEQKLRLKNFYDCKTLSTEFDNWLSIKINPNTDKDNIDYLRRVRNALLHSNFYIDEETPFMTFTQLKTKSYYESELFNMQFQMFVFEYFGNIEALGLTESLYTYLIPKEPIKNKLDLLVQLSLTTINEISYKNLKSLGIESPELFLKDSLDKDCKVDLKEFAKNLKDNKNIDDIKWKTKRISQEQIAHIIHYIEKTYGENFYKMDKSIQDGIISTHLKYRLTPKIELSNWICHFWYLYSSLSNGSFQVSFFDGDEFGVESCYAALMVLKSYLLIYRLQNNNFDEVDYSKIIFDRNDSDIILHSENEDGSFVTSDYFQDSFDKEKAKGLLTDDEIWNKVICEVVRNSLAHGNVRTYTSTLTLEPTIELKDIDPKKRTIRTIVFPLKKYEKFLNSEGFSPSNCYKKVDAKSLAKKI